MADTIPSDAFSRRRRELVDNPGVLRSASTVNLQDFYGNLETWVIETFRADGEAEVLLQLSKVDGGLRLVLPPKVMEAIDRQRGTVVRSSRRKAARQAVDTKRQKGIPIGNPAAFAGGRRGGKAEEAGTPFADARAKVERSKDRAKRRKAKR